MCRGIPYSRIRCNDRRRAIVVGSPDVDLAQVCSREGRVLVTADLDLSDLRQFPIDGRPGYIVVRLKDQSRDRQVAIMHRILKLLVTQPLKDRLWIVDEKKVRVRALPA